MIIHARRDTPPCMHYPTNQRKPRLCIAPRPTPEKDQKHVHTRLHICAHSKVPACGPCCPCGCSTGHLQAYTHLDTSLHRHSPPYPTLPTLPTYLPSQHVYTHSPSCGPCCACGCSTGSRARTPPSGRSPCPRRPSRPDVYHMDVCVCGCDGLMVVWQLCDALRGCVFVFV